MRRPSPSAFAFAFALAVAVALAAAPRHAFAAPKTPVPPAPRAPSDRASRPPFCSGEYADDLAALTARAREVEQAQYTFCVRTSAVYECPFYAADGALRKTRRTVVAHGTAFAYRRQEGDTLLITNDHVAEWPAVTDDDHPVEDVPRGCKRVSDALRIVDDETDGYERDDVPLTRAAGDPQLDIAVLRAHQALPVLPWKIGRSAAVRERNAVEVRGFPLGVLRTRNAGKVTSAYDHDDEHEWDHDDFVIDALLSPGNSGSPVLAVSCRTGEFELVGVYHAGYSRGAALNVVVAIDQVRDLMTTLRRSPRAHAEAPPALDAAARAGLAAGLAHDPTPYFPFGPLVAGGHLRPDGALVFEVLPRDFPVRTGPLLALEDLPPQDGGAFGVLGRVWAGNGSGLRAVARADLDADAQAQLARVLDGLRRDALAANALRSAARHGGRTRDAFHAARRLQRVVERAASARSDLAQTAGDLAERLFAPGSDGATLADALAPAITPAPRAAASDPPPAAGAERGDALQTPVATGQARPPAPPLQSP